MIKTFAEAITSNGRVKILPESEDKMDTERIKQLATDVNNAAAQAFQSGVDHATRPLLAKIERLETQRDELLAALNKIVDWIIPSGPRNVAKAAIANAKS